MRHVWIWFSLSVMKLAAPTCNETAVEVWLNATNSQFDREIYESSWASYSYIINVNPETSRRKVRVSSEIFQKRSDRAFIAMDFVRNCSCPGDLSSVNRRMLNKLINIGPHFSNRKKSWLAAVLKNNMTGTFGNARICAWSDAEKSPNCTLKWSLNPDIQREFAASINYDKLLYIWESWHDEVGKKMKPKFKQVLELSNEGAIEAGYSDAGDAWRQQYETADFRRLYESLWHQLLPLYEQLHTHMRRNLREIYRERMGNQSTIPAHLLGNVYGQRWDGNYARSLPFPEAESIDVTHQLREQGFTVKKLFKVAEEFFTSLGLDPMPEMFWNHTIMEKIPGRNMICHPVAFSGIYSIVLCGHPDMGTLKTIHHEMGHIQYYLQYAHLPPLFQRGANPGFHEAIGDTLAMSVTTPQHLKTIGLLSNDTPFTEKQSINFLFQTALTKIAFLPYAYIMDKYRWDLFNGSVPYDQWNSHWVDLRRHYQGYSTPGDRRNSDLFDAGAKFHVAAGVPYARYFISNILQFQFYQALCNASGHQGPLHTCDFYRNREAGAKLKETLKMGSSRSWPEILENLTGRRDISAQALIEYFDPLIKWLEERNRGDCFGWGVSWPQHVQDTLPTPRC